jgi:hypothetical protein
MTENKQGATEQLGEAVDRATAATRGRAEVEQLVRDNKAGLQRLAQQFGVGIHKVDLVNVRLAVLVEHLFGDINSLMHQDYERAVQAKMTELITGLSSEAARAKLTQGVNGVDLSKLKRPGQQG